MNLKSFGKLWYGLFSLVGFCAHAQTYENIQEYSVLGYPQSPSPFSFFSLGAVFEALNPSQTLIKTNKIIRLCQDVDIVYKRLGWGKSPCLKLPWRYEEVSEWGRPLVYWVFDDSYFSLYGLDHRHNTTLILGGVHPDELTPIHLVFRFALALHENPEKYKNARVVIAPLVNPDGFLTYPPRRTNANGVDLNRNFPTYNWKTSAYASWVKNIKKDKRKFPGMFANSEQETRFQSFLITKFNPDKIISVHAPLAFLDLDYEGTHVFSLKPRTEQQRKAVELARLVSQSAGNYRIKDFGVYPGSLGKYAGSERTIPTITLELSSSNPNLVETFWRNFSQGLFTVVQYQFKRHPFSEVVKVTARP
jgi:murein peptide amidase A